MSETGRGSEGRWLTPDPLGGDIMNPQSLNRYAYVTGNPASMNDPLGLFESCDSDPNLPGCEPPEDFLPYCYYFGCNGPGPLVLGYVGAAAGGGGGTTPSAPLPSRWQIIKQVNRCAERKAASIASLTNLNEKNFWVRTFLGNDASALSSLAFGPKRGDAAESLVVSNPTKYSLIELGAKASGKLPTGGTLYTSSGQTVLTPQGDTIDMVPTSETVGDVAGKAVGAVAEVATGVKALFDTGAYINALAGCSGLSLGGN